MCMCVHSSPLGKVLPRVWLNDSGRIAHPLSPEGLGGPGQFRPPGVHGAEPMDAMLPEAQAPLGRAVEPSLIALAEGKQKAKAKRQPPPQVTVDAAPEVAQKVLTLRLLKDLTGVEGIQSAVTDFNHIGSGQISKHADTQNKVTWFSNTMAWEISIITSYGGGNPEFDAAYGRGTTPKDQEDGNVTLGFHEHCHRQFLLNYFRRTPLPVFKGAVGDLDTVFDEKVQAHLAAIDAYFEKARTANVAAVDDAPGSDPPLSNYPKPE